MSDRSMRAMLLVLAATHVALGLWQFFAPGNFYEAVATFGARNDHFVRDVSTVMLALGIGFALAAARPTWRAPVLAVAVAQYAAHLVSHIIDVDMARTAAIGWGTVALVAGPLLLLLYLLRQALRDVRA